MPVQIELITSTAVLILTVSTIAVFIVYGYTILSYAVLIAALALAFFDVWLIQRDRAASATGTRGMQKRKRKR